MPSKLVADLIDRWYGPQVNGTIEFRDLVAACLRPDHYVLDLGCGRGREETDFRARCAFVAGCDYSDSVRQNSFISAGIRGNAYKLPFKNHVFDVVVMDYVMEHLEFPDRCALELVRVLKADGLLFFRTPNFYHYVTLIAHFTPQSFHRFVVRRLAGADEVDAFETFYRVNTSRDVTEVFTQVGLRPREIRMVEKEPYYLTFALPAFLLGYGYERLVNKFDRLAAVRSNIFGSFTKTVETSAADSRHMLEVDYIQSSAARQL